MCCTVCVLQVGIHFWSHRLPHTLACLHLTTMPFCPPDCTSCLRHPPAHSSTHLPTHPSAHPATQLPSHPVCLPTSLHSSSFLSIFFLQVNKIRELHQYPHVLITHTDAPELYVWNTDRLPDQRPVVSEAPTHPAVHPAAADAIPLNLPHTLYYTTSTTSTVSRS